MLILKALAGKGKDRHLYFNKIWTSTKIHIKITLYCFYYNMAQL